MSVFLNAVAGYLLITGDDPAGGVDAGIRFSITNASFRLILGVLTVLTGLLKVLSAVERDIPIIGDLLPALAGLAAGFILVFEYYQDHSAMEPESVEKIERVLIRHKRIIGIVSLCAAGLHFLFPRVLFL
jgi:hypothetical protein